MAKCRFVWNWQFKANVTLWLVFISILSDEVGQSVYFCSRDMLCWSLLFVLPAIIFELFHQIWMRRNFENINFLDFWEELESDSDMCIHPIQRSETQYLPLCINWLRLPSYLDLINLSHQLKLKIWFYILLESPCSLVRPLCFLPHLKLRMLFHITCVPWYL